MEITFGWVEMFLFTRGGVIPDGCVIGANSFVTKKFYESNCMIAGTPARIIKKNIRWEM